MSIATEPPKTHNQEEHIMSLRTQIHSIFVLLALFVALGLVSLTRAQSHDGASHAAVSHSQYVLAAPDADSQEPSTNAHVRVGAPIAVEARPTAQDIERAMR